MLKTLSQVITEQKEFIEIYDAIVLMEKYGLIDNQLDIQDMQLELLETMIGHMKKSHIESLEGYNEE